MVIGGGGHTCAHVFRTSRPPGCKLSFSQILGSLPELVVHQSFIAKASSSTGTVPSATSATSPSPSTGSLCSLHPGRSRAHLEAQRAHPSSRSYCPGHAHEPPPFPHQISQVHFTSKTFIRTRKPSGSAGPAESPLQVDPGPPDRPSPPRNDASTVPPTHPDLRRGKQV